jgi:hypothetical protein
MSACAGRTDVAAGAQVAGAWLSVGLFQVAGRRLRTAASGDRAASVALVASTVCVTSQAYC